MKILGIETSCDETAVSIIDAQGDIQGDFSFTVLGDALLSQATLHAEFGGVYPNLAKREHAKNLVPIFTQVLSQSQMLISHSGNPAVPKETIGIIKDILNREPELFAHLALFLATHEKPDIDAIAVTHGPGLEPALWVGINFAKALSQAWDIPIVAVDHMEGHILTSLIKREKDVNFQFSKFNFPTLALLISGGHTEFVLMDEWRSYKTIGQTRDDAIGEAFDKTARLLGLPYPGGPEISFLAQKARETDAPKDFSLPRPMIGNDGLDLSFSGLKTAVLRLVRGLEEPLSDKTKMQIAREIEDAITDVLVAKTRAALDRTSAQTLIVGGGVSANNHIRGALTKLITTEFPDTTLLLPAQEHATDNALMIALAGYFRAHRGEFAVPADLAAHGTLHRQ